MSTATQLQPRAGHSRIGRSTGRGVMWVAIGQTAVRLIGFIGNIFLARLLMPGDFGVYGLTSFAVMQLGALADLGLGTTLIHQSGEATTAEKRSVFCVHVMLALSLYLVAYAGAPIISRLCSLGSDGSAFCRIVGLVVLMLPFRTIPAAMLKRRLAFGFISVSEVLGAFVFQIVAFVLARMQFSYWSFGFALLVSTAVKTAFLHAASPWQVGISFDRRYLRRCVQFGGTLQLSSLTALVRDNLINFVGGPWFGPTSVGFLSWSYRLATYSSQTYVGICSHVSFAALSRLRSDSERFTHLLSKMLRYVTFATMLTLSIVVGLAPQIVRIVFTDKWLPAVPLFYFFALRMIAANYTTLLDLALSASGRPAQSLKIMFWWTVLEFLGALAGGALAGYKGIAVSSAVCIWFAVAWLYRRVEREIGTGRLDFSLGPVLAGLTTSLLLHFASTGRASSGPALLAAVAAGFGVFVCLCWLLGGQALFRELRADARLLYSPA